MTPRIAVAFTVIMMLIPLNAERSIAITQTGTIKVPKPAAPRWRYTYNKATLSLNITVATNGFRINEMMTQGACKMLYYHAGRTEPSEEVVRLKTPIQANVSETQTFSVAGGIERIKGLSMEWEVSVKGSRPIQGEEKGISRRGSSAPAE